MQVFGELVPAVEKYSIDECFFDLTGILHDLTAFCQGLKHTVRQWTGMPISIGIAETKTLAKIANRLTKTSAKTDGVLDLTGERWRDRALASTEVGDIWGIGRKYAKKLNRNAVMTALDLARRPDGWVRKEMGVGGLKTVRKVIGRCMQRHRHQEFIRFLNAIEADIPAGKGVHVILDNYAAHKHAKVRAWLGRHERFTFHFVPTSCSWLNAVEGFFAKLSKRRLKRGVFRSIVDLQVAINRFLDETNDNPKPFTWTADPDKIIAAVKRGHQVLDSIH